jgi:hypothetical protein
VRIGSKEVFLVANSDCEIQEKQHEGQLDQTLVIMNTKFVESTLRDQEPARDIWGAADEMSGME